MNREIRFRGKRIDNKEWAYGDLLQYNDGSVCIGVRSKTFTDDGYQNVEYSNVYYVDEYTIGQFTGLYDKNGKEIYEGDIVRFYFMTFKTGTSELFQTSNFLGEIKTNKYNQYMILSNGLEIHIENAIKYGEIIGNIHDDPELLKQQ